MASSESFYLLGCDCVAGVCDDADGAAAGPCLGLRFGNGAKAFDNGIESRWFPVISDGAVTMVSFEFLGGYSSP